MKKTKQILSAIIACTLLLILFTGCKSETDKVIDDMEAFANKWENKLENGNITTEDKADFKTEIFKLNARGEKIKQNASTLTSKQVEKITSTGQRIAKLMMNSKLMDMPGF